jgi:hypothetical protein
MGAFSSGGKENAWGREASRKGGYEPKERGRREKRERMGWAWKG